MLRSVGVIGLAALLAFAPEATAGRNAGGSAFVTWDVSGDSTTTPGLPPAPTPLYVHLRDVFEVRELAVSITISPCDSTTRCFRFAAPPDGTVPQVDCGLATPASAPLVFEGDSTYTWSILFSPDDHGRRRIAYYIAAHECPEATSASCVLNAVVVMDSTGTVDTLAVTGAARVQPPPRLAAVSPTQVLTGGTSALTITGAHYRPGAEVSLENSQGSITAFTTTEDSARIVVQIQPPAGQAGLYDLVLHFPNSSTTVAPDAVTVQSGAAPASVVNRPTDDANAYTRINIHSHIARWYPYEQYITVYGYPDWLDNPHLLVMGAGSDTVGLFLSQSKDGLALYYPYEQMGFVRYGAGRTASSVGLLSVAANAYAGGPSDDTNRPFISVMTHHVNGDSSLTKLRIGQHMRNQYSGPYGCGTYYAAAPTDSLCHEVFSGPRFDDVCFYDVQEVRLPKSHRGSVLDYVEVRADSSLRATCDQRTTYLFGLSLWNRFRVANASGNGVGLMLQSDWTGSPYGGYYDQSGALVGSDRSIAELGCLLTSICMVHGFYGISVTPGALNDWLQRRQDGYGRSPVARITSIGPGDSVGFRWRGPAKHGPMFLVEHGLRAPIATVRIVDLHDTTGLGVVTARHSASPIVVNDLGYVYNNVNTDAASKGYSETASTKWQVMRLGKSTTAPGLAEAAMAADMPVLVNTRLDATNRAQHWVVGAGREPAFTSATTARGTYVVRDPEWPVTRLLQAPHFNGFTDVRSCSPITGQQAALVDTSGLEFVLSGPAFLTVTDPLGRLVTYETSTDDYASSIPDADMWRSFVIEDVSDTTTEDPAVDVVRLPGAAGGSYLLTVTGQGSGDYSLSASVMGASGEMSGADMMGATEAGSAAYYRVVYSPSSGSLSSSVTDVSPGSELVGSFKLDAWPNPVSGGTRIAWTIARPGPTRVSVYDLAGHCVRTLAAGHMPPGRHGLVWDGRDANGHRVGAGMYFVRLVSGNERLARRIVVLP